MTTANTIAAAVDRALAYASEHWSDFFRAVAAPFDTLLFFTEYMLRAVPWSATALLMSVICLWRAGVGSALLVLACMSAIEVLDLWQPAMTTMAMVIVAMVISMFVGLPLGILCGRSDGFNSAMRFVLDAAQTIHPFVYLVPIVFLFGIGKVPGTIATVIVAFPPIVRLTSIGIRQVPSETREAAEAFGASSTEILFDVELPLASSAIMAGVNQALMLSLSMVIIVALIAGGGLGQEIYRAIGRIDVGQAIVAGSAVLFLAVALDRTSRPMERPIERRKRRADKDSK